MKEVFSESNPTSTVGSGRSSVDDSVQSSNNSIIPIVTVTAATPIRARGGTRAGKNDQEVQSRTEGESVLDTHPSPPRRQTIDNDFCTELLEKSLPLAHDLQPNSTIDHKEELSVSQDEFDPNLPHIKALRWKIDKRLVPMLSLLYLCSFLDRSNVGNARIIGLETDLGLLPGQFGVVSIFYVGYILGEIPANLVLKMMGPRRWMAIIMVVWGGIMMATAAVHNFVDLSLARFFLGLGESGFAPGATYMISLWYIRREQTLRIGIYFSAATVAGAFGGVLSYYIARLDGYLGLRGWQWIFILEGLPTVLIAFFTWIALPDFPETSDFLTVEEKELTARRLRADAGPATSTTFEWEEVWMVFKDWKTYFHGAIAMLVNFACGSLSLFIPTIVLGFNFDPITTQIMTAPIFVAACICTLLIAWSADRHQDRGFHMAFAQGLAMVGYIFLILTRNSSVIWRYLSLMLTTVGAYGSVPVMLVWPTSNMGGHTKRGVAVATVVGISHFGSIAGGMLYPFSEGPFYIRSHGLVGVAMGINIVLALVFKWLLWKENKRRDELDKEAFEEEAARKKCDGHPAFRFIS